MKDSLQNIELIERYFDNEMSEEEKVKFHESLKSDLELKHQFDREKLLINTVKFGAAKKTLEFLKDLDQSMPQVEEESKKSRFMFAENWSYYVAAAAVIGLLVAAGVFFLNPVRATPENLYAEYFEPFPNPFGSAKRGGTVDAKAEAFQAYENKDFEKASLLFSDMLKKESDPGVLFLLGNANLAAGKTTEAKANFTNLISNFDDLDTQAKWYLSLCYLREGEIEPARKVLVELSDTENPYATKAKELLEKVN